MPPTASLAPANVPSRKQANPKEAKPTPAAADANANRVYQVADLPDAIRRELPPVAVNGSSYSADAASRVLIANGQVLHEGDAVAPGATLEKIGRRSAVLTFKGYRYELTY